MLMKNKSTQRVIISAIVLATIAITMQSAGAFRATDGEKISSNFAEIVSLPKEFTLAGTSLLLIGKTDSPNHWVTVDIWRGNAAKPALSKRFISDEYRSFLHVLDLAQLCMIPSTDEYTLTLNNTPEHLFRMECPHDQAVYPFEGMQFAGTSLGGTTAQEEIYVDTPNKAIFEASGQPWMHAFTAYASVVMSRDMYVGNQGRMKVSPWQYLEPGKHHFYMAPYDPIRKIVYQPLTVPFHVEGGMGEQLKSTVYYAPGAASILLLVFFGSVLYIRRMKYLRRGICFIGEDYPDDYPEHFVG